ncbi:hypothetical protein TIFTF001_021650 [Ficus carica]|uniref:Uncharacterized protein n=1 Tax=Ficus carica TaxID=3494 RepID=A0AA88AAX2_FICCA|nr:hypothetical protein TIFTF001_021650 [Ficus carica]
MASSGDWLLFTREGDLIMLQLCGGDPPHGDGRRAATRHYSGGSYLSVTKSEKMVTDRYLVGGGGCRSVAIRCPIRGEESLHDYVPQPHCMATWLTQRGDRVHLLRKAQSARAMRLMHNTWG